jgi:hypothetical protein
VYSNVVHQHKAQKKNTVGSASAFYRAHTVPSRQNLSHTASALRGLPLCVDPMQGGLRTASFWATKLFTAGNLSHTASALRGLPLCVDPMQGGLRTASFWATKHLHGRVHLFIIVVPSGPTALTSKACHTPEECATPRGYSLV